jgi:hypothetical protein
MYSKNSILARAEVAGGGRRQLLGSPQLIAGGYNGRLEDVDHRQHPGVPDAPEQLYALEDDGCDQEPR